MGLAPPCKKSKQGTDPPGQYLVILFNRQIEIK